MANSIPPRSVRRRHVGLQPRRDVRKTVYAKEGGDPYPKRVKPRWSSRGLSAGQKPSSCADTLRDLAPGPVTNLRPSRAVR
jgi:hypothetical protein